MDARGPHRPSPAGVADAQEPAAVAARFDIYVAIHKALRHFMNDALLNLGRMDAEDAAEVERTCAQAAELLRELRHHVRSENDHLHTAIEARRPAAAARTVEDHGEHLATIAELEDELLMLRRAGGARRQVLAQQFYRHVALFVAENLQHMQVEETANNATLWALYSDEELVALHGRLLDGIGPAEMALLVRWMARSVAPQELATICLDARVKLPPDVLAPMLELIRAELDEGRRAQLARALGAAAAPGLVQAR
jgi:hemerythrin-like domain-containing protein